MELKIFSILNFNVSNYSLTQLRFRGFNCEKNSTRVISATTLVV